MSKVMGIYKITNNINGKIYIGSAVDFSRRWREHLRLLRLQKHSNHHLQNAYNLYGESTFEFEIIEHVDDINNLLSREQFWIDSIGINALYNLSPLVGRPSGMKGKTFSAEHKAKISRAHKGKNKPPLSPEHKAKISQANIGKHSSAEKSANMSRALKGKKKRPMSDETKAKMSLSRMGHQISQKTKEKISKAHTGKVYSSERKAQMSITSTGQKHQSRWKAIRQIDPTSNEVVAIFPSITEAVRALGLKYHSNISKALRGLLLTSSGYRWEYAAPKIPSASN